MKKNLYMGVDVSTQSISISFLEIEGKQGQVVLEQSFPYAQLFESDSNYGNDGAMLLPQEKEGEAMQSPLMFLETIDIAFEQLKTKIDFSIVQTIAVSAQQHGHVYLRQEADDVFAGLNHDANQTSHQSLKERFKQVFSFPHAPIWMMTASEEEAKHIKDTIDENNNMLSLSGSDSPTRFTGAIIKYIAKTYPKEYAQTHRIHLLSSFISGILSARADCPIDWGNGSGMSLMDYKKRHWSSDLASAVSNNQNSNDVLSKLPKVSSPIDVSGNIAQYFVNKYGFSKDCTITIGSGDNPQSKVVVQGDLISLGTSLVLMVEQKDTVVIDDIHAMYDGLGRPFLFACRTNGALIWDQVRNALNMNYSQANDHLKKSEIGKNIFLYQPYTESFPLSKSFEQITDAEDDKKYSAIIDTTLALLHAYSKDFMKTGNSNPIFVTGGPSTSNEILHRIAVFWNRPVIRIKSSGASLGAALSAYASYQTLTNKDINMVMTHIYEYIVPTLLQEEEILLPKDWDSVCLHQKAMEFEKKVIDKFEPFLKKT